MNFLKKMKSREMCEMGLKTVAAVILGLILIILMEGMIYSIYIKAIQDNKDTTSYTTKECVLYCEKIGEDKYQVYVHNTQAGAKNRGWHLMTKNYTSAELVIEEESNLWGDIVYHAPTPFDISITTTHYFVMGGFILVILGVCGFMFYRLNRDYVKFEKKYKKTGKIFA